MVPDLYDEYCDKVWKQITYFHAVYLSREDQTLAAVLHNPSVL